MIKKITTPSDKEIKLSSSAVFLLLYKDQFKSDPLKDILEMAGSLDAKEELTGDDLISLDLPILYNLAWALAKCADPKKVGDPLEFYSKNEDFLPLDHVDAILDLAMGSMTTDVNIKAKN